MSSKGFSSYKIYNQNEAYFLTFTTVGWIDIFTRKVYKDIVINSFKYCRENKGLLLFAYVIMSNHIHLIARANEGYKLSEIIRDLKKFTSKQIKKAIDEEPESRRKWMKAIFRVAGKSNSRNEDFQFWRQGNHPIEILSSKIFEQKLNYIHINPVKQGIVEKAEDYLYSSARNFAELASVMEIDGI
jgi:REP element-mobilizing transposase RayT